MTTPFDKLHHVCIVVHDIDKSQAYYESIGIGPWIAYPPLSEYSELNVPNPTAFAQMQYRICNLPNIQIQLCQPSPDPSPQRTHLDTKGEGVFHLGFEVPDADAAQAAVGIGFEAKAGQGHDVAPGKKSGIIACLQCFSFYRCGARGRLEG